jgi:hypothetical protein
VPRSPADPRRAAPPEGPGRVHAALQRPSASPGTAVETSAARTGQAIDMTARIERNRAVGGLISEYRRAA